eukprot:3111911-Amphidinium_carterae.1
MALLARRQKIIYDAIYLYDFESNGPNPKNNDAFQQRISPWWDQMIHSESLIISYAISKACNCEVDVRQENAASE